jgi:hypothetical protein
MCPACIANIAVLTVGATSGGGVAAFVFNKFYGSSKRVKTKDNQNEKQRKEDGSPQNRVVERMGSCAPKTPREGEGTDPSP